MTQLFETMQPQTQADALGSLNYAGAGVGGSAASLNLGSLIGANNSASAV